MDKYHGKARQRFTQREIQRANRAAPNRTIVIRPDGAMELVPVTFGPDLANVNPFDIEAAKLRKQQGKE